MAAGFDLKTFFQNSSSAIPIVHAEVDFFCPLYCGDRLLINLLPKLLNDQSFEINYQLLKDSLPCAQAWTKHICIDPLTRKKKPLPEDILKNFF
jgi:1,4-dihydroxy-2-naphthoyl-CoA hydrolase